MKYSLFNNAYNAFISEKVVHTKDNPGEGYTYDEESGLFRTPKGRYVDEHNTIRSRKKAIEEKQKASQDTQLATTQQPSSESSSQQVSEITDEQIEQIAKEQAASLKKQLKDSGFDDAKISDAAKAIVNAALGEKSDSVDSEQVEKLQQSVQQAITDISSNSKDGEQQVSSTQQPNQSTETSISKSK